MTTESTPPAPQRGRASRVLHTLLYIYAAVTIIPFTILGVVMLIAHDFYDTRVQIHPDHSIGLSRGEGELSHHFYLESASPEWESYIGLQGIAQDGEDVYVLYHANEYYRIALDGTERERLKQLPAHIELEEPVNFWLKRR